MRIKLLNCPSCGELSLQVRKDSAFSSVAICTNCKTMWLCSPAGDVAAYDPLRWALNLEPAESLAEGLDDLELSANSQMALLWIAKKPINTIAATYTVSTTRVRNAVGQAIISWSNAGLLTLPSPSELLAGLAAQNA